MDKKIDIVEKIPNLRKVSITPWANVDIAAEAINKKYVLSSKPNPAAVAVPVLSKDNLKKEIGTILAACKKIAVLVISSLKISVLAARGQRISLSGAGSYGYGSELLSCNENIGTIVGMWRV